MKVVTYSRVSTLAQETEGASLENQERAFTRWLERTGHVRVAAYREAASAGTIAGRAEFTRMIAELPKTKPDAIVIDTLDRFTRSLRDGLNLIEEFRGHHVGLLPLDWRREKPINIDDDRDWRDIVDEFTSAESERRRIRRRIVRAYEGRRERGATTVYKTPVGVLKQGDRLVPHPETAWVVKEIDHRILAGQSQNEIAAWTRGLNVGISNRTAIRHIAMNHNYVAAGVRSPETQTQLDRIYELAKERCGKHSTHEHVITGVIACGYCGSLMSGKVSQGYSIGPRVYVPMIACDRGAKTGQHKTFSTAEHKVMPLWDAYVDRILKVFLDENLLAAWAAREQGDVVAKRVGLERSLAQIDQRAAQLKARRDRALDLLGDKNPALDRQARKLLVEVDADEMALHASRETILSDLRQVEVPTRDVRDIVANLEGYRREYAEASAHRKNQLNRLLCQAIGSHPQLTRVGGIGRHHGKSPGGEPILVWPEIDAIFSASISGASPSAMPSVCRA